MDLRPPRAVDAFDPSVQADEGGVDGGDDLAPAVGELERVNAAVDGEPVEGAFLLEPSDRQADRLTRQTEVVGERARVLGRIRGDGGEDLVAGVPDGAAGFGRVP